MTPIVRALRNLCPRCGRAPLFQGVFTLHDTCPACSARHERMVGSWTIASWISASIGVTFGGILTVLLYTKEGFTPGIELVIIGTSAAFALLSYRPVKAITFGGLHAVGMGQPDPVQVGNVIFLERYKARRDSDGEHPQGDARQVEGNTGA